MGELMAGIPLTVAPLTWSFVGVSLRANGTGIIQMPILSSTTPGLYF